MQTGKRKQQNRQQGFEAPELQKKMKTSPNEQSEQVANPIISNENQNDEDDFKIKSPKELMLESLFYTKNMFLYNQSLGVPSYSESTKLKLKVKTNDLYKTSLDHLHNRQTTKQKKKSIEVQIEDEPDSPYNQEEYKQDNKPQTQIQKLIDTFPQKKKDKLSKVPLQFLRSFNKQKGEEQEQGGALVQYEGNRQIMPFQNNHGAIVARKLRKLVKPVWHPPWKLMKVISGHHGWVRCVDVDPTNQWFVTGSNDRTIKFWDLGSGQLKLTLTGHKSTIRSVVVSKRHTYLFSCGEDKEILCWDLEQNKVIRRYFGHLSGVYCLSQHPTLDILASGGRDATVRLWDIRTKTQIHCLGGHRNVVESVACQEFEPQIISGSHDKMVRLWDIGMGKTVKTLTNHKKAIRGLAIHPEEYTFCSASSDNVKVWKCPDGDFLRNISGHNAILNACAINSDNVLVTGGDNGSLYFWDWKSGYNFQQIQSKPQPGSISSESGIWDVKFDHSSLRLITAECDKTIKIWKEDEEATPETHPIDPTFRTDFVNQRY